MVAISRTVGTEGLTVDQWTAATTLDLDIFGSIPALTDPDRWQEWGASVIGLASLSGIVLPDPYTFDDWRDWAQNFNAVLDGRQ